MKLILKQWTNLYRHLNNVKNTMSDKYFLLHPDVIESALSSSKSMSIDSRRCYDILRTIMRTGHKIVISESLKQKYIKRCSNFSDEKFLKSNPVALVLGGIFRNATRTILIQDSSIIYDKLNDCESKIASLALKNDGTIIVALDSEFRIKIKEVVKDKVNVLNVEHALPLAHVDEIDKNWL